MSGIGRNSHELTNPEVSDYFVSELSWRADRAGFGLILGLDTRSSRIKPDNRPVESKQREGNPEGPGPCLSPGEKPAAATGLSERMFDSLRRHDPADICATSTLQQQEKDIFTLCS